MLDLPELGPSEIEESLVILDLIIALLERNQRSAAWSILIRVLVI